MICPSLNKKNGISWGCVLKSKHHHKSHIEDSDLSEKESQKLSLNSTKVNIKHTKGPSDFNISFKLF